MLLDWAAFLLLLAFFVLMSRKSVVVILRLFASCRRRSAYLALALLLPFLLVRLPDAAANWAGFLDDLGATALYVAVPVTLLLYRPAGRTGRWLVDGLTILAVWFPIEFGWLPDLPLALADGVDLPGEMLMAIDLALLLFLVILPLPRVGYTFRLTRDDGRRILIGLAAFTVVGIPVGLLTGFLTFGLNDQSAFEWIAGWPLGYLFTALPEEFLFRGVIQQRLQQEIPNEKLALVIASVIFGLAHLNNGTPGFPEPNWMYAVMATLAGLAYGWTWQKTGKITASAVVHASVNFIWGALL